MTEIRKETCTVVSETSKEDVASSSQEKEFVSGNSSSDEDLSSEELYPTGPRLWITVFALVVSIFLLSLDLTIVATAIPAITDEFGGLEDVVWYGASFFMTISGFQAFWGKVYLYFPLKLSFLIAIFFFLVGSLICGVAPDSVTFIVGRAIAGVGCAGVSCGCYILIGYMVEPRKRATYTGLLGAIYGLGSVIGPLLGGVFAEKVSWRWCFYINLPIGAIPIGTIIFLFKTPAGAKPRQATLKEKIYAMDLPGVTLIMGATITYILAVHYGGSIHPWSDSTVIGLLVGAILLYVSFGVCEWLQGERAMIIPRLIMQRELGISAFYMLLQAGGFFVVIYYLPIYFQAVRGASPIDSGVRTLPLILGASLGTFGAGLFITRTGLAIFVMFVGAAIGLLGSGLCYMLDVHTSTGTWIGFQILAGFGGGAAFQIPVMVGQTTVKEEDLPAATSMMLCFQQLGATISLSAAQCIFVNRLILELPSKAPTLDPHRVVATGAGMIRHVFTSEEVMGIVAAYLDGIRGAFIWTCVVIGAAMLLSLLLPWKRLYLAAVANAAGAA